MQCSNNSLTEVNKCSTMAYVHKVMGLRLKEEFREPEPWTVAGSAIHAARLEHLVHRDVDAAMDLFDEMYREYSVMANQSGKYSYVNIALLLRAWLTKTTPIVETWDVLSTESFFSVELLPGIFYEGFVDAVCKRVGTAVPFCYELKTRTSESPWWLKKWPMNPQPTGYHWVLQQQYPDLIVGEPVVEVLYMDDLKPGKAKCKLHSVPKSECAAEHVNYQTIPVPRKDSDIQTWLAEARRSAQKLQQLYLYKDQPKEGLDYADQEGIYTDACMFCDVQSFCRSGRPAHRLYDFFEPRLPREM